MTACHCGLDVPYLRCCAVFHVGTATPPTAERLMRSRYSAYVVRDRSYLLQTWHPSTRPRRLELGAMTWERLEVLATTGGGLLETEATVRFRAHFRGGVLEEHSRFVRDAGRWSYLGPVP